VGRAHYSGLLTVDGTYIDDLLCYHLGDGDYMLVVNAANAGEDWAWVKKHADDWNRRFAADHGAVEVKDVSDEYALIAVQGPQAVALLSGLTKSPIGELRYYGFSQCRVGQIPALVSRTGYTGEDGYELYVAPDHASGLWEMLMVEGEKRGLVPAGLGARDTLRLEAAMALYGHELDRTTTPWEAGLAWVVKLDKGDFIGRDALVAQKEAGVERKLVGFELEGRGIARQDHKVLAGGEEVGVVTSGTWSPTFEKALGMAYVGVDHAAVGGALEIEVRGRRIAARVVEMPFYKRPK
jgi:aminomethyltransferase